MYDLLDALDSLPIILMRHLLTLQSMSDTTSTGNQSFAALSAHLAGMHFGQGTTSRHTSLPAALDAPATDSNLQESAVVQVRILEQ